VGEFAEAGGGNRKGKACACVEPCGKKKTCVLNIVASKDLTPGLNFFAGTKLHKSGRSMNRQTKNNLRGRRSSPRKPRKASRSERQAGGREEGGRGRRGGRRGRDREEKWGAE
jgi:hypothetical protein